MGVNPAMAASLASLFQQAQPGQTSGSGAPPPPPGAAPPAPAAPPSAGGMQDYANLAQQQQSQLLSSAPAQEATRQRAAAGGFAQESANVPLPTMAPRIEKGAGFLHNLGQALQMVSMATKPGAAVFGPEGPVYGPGMAEYKAKQAGLMGQRQAAESAAEGAEKELGSVAGVTGRTIMGGSKVESTAMNAAQRANAVMVQHQDKLAQISAMKDVAAKRIAAQEEIQRMHDDMMIQTTGMKDTSQQEVAGIMTNSAQTLLNTKIAEDPSIAGYIKRVFGVGGAQAPGGEQPVEGQAPAPKRGAAPAAKKPAAKGAGPKPGVVEGGYRFNGGDPSNPKSWTKVGP